MSYKIKTNIIYIFTFFALWQIYYHNIISLSVKISNPDIFVTYLMSSGYGYNNLCNTVGVFIAVFYLVSFHKKFRNENSSVIVRCGKDRYIMHCFKQTCLHTLTFILEFCVVNTLCILIYCDLNMLLNLNFILCNLLYFIILFLIFLLLGSLCQFFRIQFSFNKIYLAVILIIIAFFRILSFFFINISPIYFASFIDDWMQEGTFDLINYIKNALICIIVSAILATAARLVFLKKDILINEEEN